MTPRKQHNAVWSYLVNIGNFCLGREFTQEFTASVSYRPGTHPVLSEAESTHDQIMALDVRLRRAGRTSDVEGVVQCLKELAAIEITTALLTSTKIGITVNALGGPVRRPARALIKRWKRRVQMESMAKKDARARGTLSGSLPASPVASQPVPAPSVAAAGKFAAHAHVVCAVWVEGGDRPAR